MNDDWSQLLERHRRAQIEKLRMINRGDIVASDEERAETARAASGAWWSSPLREQRTEPPARWTESFRTREYSTGIRRR
jgi:hypothetical protein